MDNSPISNDRRTELHKEKSSLITVQKASWPGALSRTVSALCMFITCSCFHPGQGIHCDWKAHGLRNHRPADWRRWITSIASILVKKEGTSKSGTHVKVRDIQTSLENSGIMAVFTPANRDKEGYLWQEVEYFCKYLCINSAVLYYTCRPHCKYALILDMTSFRSGGFCMV